MPIKSIPISFISLCRLHYHLTLKDPKEVADWEEGFVKAIKGRGEEFSFIQDQYGKLFIYIFCYFLLLSVIFCYCLLFSVIFFRWISLGQVIYCYFFPPFCYFLFFSVIFNYTELNFPCPCKLSQFSQKWEISSFCKKTIKSYVWIKSYSKCWNWHWILKLLSKFLIFSWKKSDLKKYKLLLSSFESVSLLS